MEYFNLLKNLIEVNSYSENKKGVDKVGQLIKKELPFMDLKEYKSRKYGNLLYFQTKRKKNKPKVLLCGHSDTIHPPESEFPIKKIGNKLYGPGTNDMKAGLVVIVEVLKALHLNEQHSDIDFVLIPDEEIGSKTHKDVLSKIYRKYDYVLVYEETTPEASAGVRKYKANRMTLVTGRKGFGGAIVKVSSMGGHSGAVFKKKDRHNSILEAAHKIIKLEQAANYKKGTTVNTGTIQGGKAINVIADYCEFKVDYRVKTIEERERIRSAFNQIIAHSNIKGTSSDMEWIYDIYPMTLDKKGEVILREAREVAAITGTELLTEERFGSSDANHIYKLSVPVIDGLGPQGEDEHTVKEFVYLDSIPFCIDFNKELLKKLTA